MSGEKHDWHGWDGYEAAHESKMDEYRGHFVVSEELRPDVTPNVVYWRGRLICCDGLEIEVDKTLATRWVRGSLWVRTRDYKYHVQQRSPGGVRKIFRYDSSAHHPHHPTRHHKHLYRVGDEDDGGILTHVGRSWPTLGEVLDEAHQWWLDNRESEPG